MGRGCQCGSLDAARLLTDHIFGPHEIDSAALIGSPTSDLRSRCCPIAGGALVSVSQKAMQFRWSMRGRSLCLQDDMNAVRDPADRKHEPKSLDKMCVSHMFASEEYYDQQDAEHLSADIEYSQSCQPRSLLLSSTLPARHASETPSSEPSGDKVPA